MKSQKLAFWDFLFIKFLNFFKIILYIIYVNLFLYKIYFFYFMRNIIEQFNASTISIDLQEFADALMQGYNDNNRKLYTKEQQNEILGYLKLVLSRENFEKLLNLM